MSERSTALDLALSQCWAIQENALRTILDIAGRQNLESIEAVETRLGRPLRNTRAVTMRGDVAVIPVHGPIFRRANLFTEISGATSIEQLALDFQTSLDDPAVAGIVLDIDSPGGSASGVAEFAAQVRAARGNKPVTAYAGSLAASAGYWIAAAAERVVIDSTAMVGSIGVVAGLRVDNDPKRIEIVSSQSPRKRMDLTTHEGRADIQATIDDVAQVFIDTMAEYRGVDAKTVLSDFGQGGVLVGERAVKAGMADALGSLESVIAGLSGETTRNVTMTTKTPSPDITRDLIAAEHPAIADAFRKEGADQATAALSKDHETALAAARIEGATQERERIQAVEAAALPGHNALIAALKFDGKTTGPEAAAKVITAERELRAKRGGDIDADRGSAFVPAGAEEGAGDESKPAAGKKDFDALVAQSMVDDKDLTKGRAIAKVARDHPEAHQAYLAKQRSAA